MLSSVNNKLVSTYVPVANLGGYQSLRAGQTSRRDAYGNRMCLKRGASEMSWVKKRRRDWIIYGTTWERALGFRCALHLNFLCKRLY